MGPEVAGELRADGLWWRFHLANPKADAAAAYRAGLAQADADVLTAQAMTARAEATLGRIAAMFPEVLVGGDTVATLSKTAGWIRGATESAGTELGRLLTNKQALADAGLVTLAHDLLNELSVLRSAAAVLDLLLDRVVDVVENSATEN